MLEIMPNFPGIMAGDDTTAGATGRRIPVMKRMQECQRMREMTPMTYRPNIYCSSIKYTAPAEARCATPHYPYKDKEYLRNGEAALWNISKRFAQSVEGRP